ncbi:Aspartyl aminopeptidase [Peptoclostridium litorale DSM 5388]|uniref:M18 family aminopeptidase n=1 Tax=Peptoclostridium litorale DSM 5388 TaxID=1121324 RepID=A0A069RB31_PEPLI|nr:aminopeptidase [Peptoclostridium litorale]KDR94003.1 putative M18 family aminopeptidase 1 [Peptoclostridium litorale DSM 5388]SIN79415.1 Aspartyl aminopeptidase [Peptoclostridium litorale DSM 5388]
MQLNYEFKNAWKGMSPCEKEEVMAYCQRYKKFLDEGKTERECTRFIADVARKNGFVDFRDMKDGELSAGDKVYFENRGKGAALFIIGKEDIEKGMNIVGGHIDSPRLDLKPFPLYEESEMALLKTHYYGGVKKYQWASIPLSLHGVIIKTSGEAVNINIGEDNDDPVFYISDLLPHLAKDQMQKKASEFITGEGLNIIAGSMPDPDEEKNAIKMNVLKLLNEKYGMVEEDFISAELQVVPAGKARDVGLDRSLMAAYGHDDRVCSFACLEALLEVESPQRTCVAVFADKEEIGSVGNTGMESKFFENAVAELINLQGDYNELKLKRAFASTKVLSADVTAGFDSNFPEVMDKKNSAYIGKGLVIAKYTGARGKSGCNDANAEFVASVRNIFNENGVVWQIGELGKVDQGGGGTIAYILANYGAEVVDCGVALLSMHAPMELASKVDAYMAKKGYLAFLKNA